MKLTKEEKEELLTLVFNEIEYYSREENYNEELLQFLYRLVDKIKGSN